MRRRVATSPAAPDIVNPPMLGLARLSRGLTQVELAAALGIQQGTVSKREAGTLTVGLEDLRSLSRALDYPLSFFCQHEPLDGPGVAEPYYARRGKSVGTVDLHRAYATATIRCLQLETLMRSAERPAAAFPAFTSDEHGSAAQIARIMREQLQIPPGPIHNITSTIEEAGGIVIGCDFETPLIDAFTRRLRSTSLPVFFVNRDLSPDTWRWTLAHELGHAVMHTNQSPSEAIEAEADAFATEFLMPEQLIRHELAIVDLNRLAELKTYWKVSMRALILRSQALDLITSRQRSALFQQLNKASYKEREPEVLDPPVESPNVLVRLIQHHLSKLRYTGVELAQLLHLFEHEFIAQYLPHQSSLRPLKAR